VSWFLFIILAFFTLAGGLGVVVTRNVVHAALFLLVSLVAVAGLYLILFAEFLALVQVLIYGGAIIIVLLFAIMLTRSAEYPRISDNKQWPLAAVAAAAVGVVLGAAFWDNNIPETSPNSPAFADLANSLFTTWAIPFEVASLVLLVALIGAIIIARTGEDNR
jgi:NADH-quinone oxidoreductase subunit J